MFAEINKCHYWFWIIAVPLKWYFRELDFEVNKKTLLILCLFHTQLTDISEIRVFFRYVTILQKGDNPEIDTMFEQPHNFVIIYGINKRQTRRRRHRSMPRTNRDIILILRRNTLRKKLMVTSTIRSFFTYTNGSIPLVIGNDGSCPPIKDWHSVS